MIEIINDINEKNGSELNMRIGIHTGDIIAGVIGTKLVRFDIYGPDVLIANKMESGGEPGRINISEVTKHILESNYPGVYNYEFNTEMVFNMVNLCYLSYFLTKAD